MTRAQHGLVTWEVLGRLFVAHFREEVGVVSSGLQRPQSRLDLRVPVNGCVTNLTGCA
ncbi:hypothetical protein P7K49_035556, partial [Saguinus oedipus]